MVWWPAARWRTAFPIAALLSPCYHPTETTDGLMRRFRTNSIGIDHGSVVLFSDFEDGGEMWTGSGPRETRRKVAFSQPYLEPPVVQVSMSMWDMDQKTNQRADISAEAIGESGFELVFRTWGDTRVARVRADWTAFGPVRDDEDWEVV